MMGWHSTRFERSFIIINPMLCVLLRRLTQGPLLNNLDGSLTKVRIRRHRRVHTGGWSYVGHIISNTCNLKDSQQVINNNQLYIVKRKFNCNGITVNYRTENNL